MLFKKLLHIICLLIIVSTEQHVWASETMFGSYIGMIQHSNTNQEQLAKIDFITNPKAGSTLEISAILTVYFGSFDSSEYVSYHFPDVRYDMVTGRLIFNSDDMPLSIVSSKFKNGELTASIRSKWSGPSESIMSLRQVSSVTPTLPLIKQLAGEYLGSCGSTETKLQLLSYRSNKGIQSPANPFAAYEIRGQILDRLTVVDDKPFINRDLIRSGFYNFFQNRISLQTRRGKLECQTNETGISCGECEFKRVSFEPDTINKDISRANPVFQTESRNSNAPILSGRYLGYIHHERLNQFQRVQINIDMLQRAGANNSRELSLAASGQLQFGGEGGDDEEIESIPLQFSEVGYPSPVNANQTVVLRNGSLSSGDTVQLRPIASGVLGGVWYSHLFGRVGTIQLIRSELDPIKLPEHSKYIDKIGGIFGEDKIWDLEIVTRAEINVGDNANPFFPNILSGSFTARGLTYPMMIIGGSYDYFTESVALEMEQVDHVGTGSSIAAGLNPVWVGRRTTSGGLELSLASGKWGTRDGFESKLFEVKK